MHMTQETAKIGSLHYQKHLHEALLQADGIYQQGTM